MTAKIKLLSPNQINTYYYKELTNRERAQRILQAERSKMSRIISLVAEEFKDGQYILIEKFEYYAALKKLQPNVKVPCLIYPRTNETERLLHILKVSIPLEPGTGWVFKNEHVMRLIEEHQLSVKEIASRINFNTSIINNYILDRRIPLHIREQAIEMGARTVLEKICSSKDIPKPLKLILYEKAIIEQKNDYRLTIKKFEYMKELCSTVALPTYFLYNKKLLKTFVEELLSTNFEIKEHMGNLFKSFLNRKEWDYKTDHKEKIILTIH